MASDLISRSKAVELVKFYEGQCDGIFHATKELGRMPTVDAVEVVRCENCEFWIGEMYKDPTLGYCEICDRVTDNDDFCSRGIKMDGGDEA